SSDRIGSPIITNPTVLVAMNIPSFDKFEKKTVPGGMVFVDSSLVSRKAEREDVSTYYVPATQIARDKGITKLANIIIVGKIIKELGFCDEELIAETMQKVVPARKAELYDLNMKALKIGMEL
ncbi:MAG: 2-oxoacid:ferredoxin oxidoreductase subunit gamma, partial [Clostridiales bacterium]|nr:2-oxoacid:ferredoxin oxidoreductase subunit gamma [Clostridiales bacterium]